MAQQIRVDEPNGSDTAILRAVAECRGVDPVDVDDRLVNVVDADKLAEMWGPDGDGEVTFQFSGCCVTVTSDGVVEATPV